MTAREVSDVLNKDKNRKHNVEQYEIEQVFFNPPIIVLLDTHHSGEEARWKVLGRTSSGRLLLGISKNIV